MELELDIDLSQIETQLEKLDGIKKDISSLKDGQSDKKDKAMKDLVVVMESLQGIFSTPLSVETVNLEGLSSLEKEIVAVQKAIRGIKIPKVSIPKNDTSKLEKLVKTEIEKLGIIIKEKSNDGHVMIDNFDEMPVSLDRGVTTVDGVTVPAPVETNYDKNVADDSVDANMNYVGEAAIGSATSASVWRVYRNDETSGLEKRWANDTDGFVHVWDDRESEVY